MSSSWRDRLDALGGRRRDVLTIAGIALLAIVVASVALGRPAPAEIAPPAVALPAADGSSSPAVEIVVHVSGAVRSPGIYAFRPGARVADAIAAAGGARSAADLAALNLAAFLVDGTQVNVPGRGRTARQVPADPTPGPINVNSADALLLETVPGIGPATAAAIIRWREEHGLFDSVDRLIEVPGIGPATLESMRPYLAV